MQSLHGLLVLALGTVTTTILDARSAAESPVVFVSSFAPGDQGAIQAFQFHTDKGTLQLLQRTPGIEHPFFMALAPQGNYLYAIHAREFSGQDEEQVAAFQVVGRSGELRLRNRQSTRGKASCYLQVDQTNKTLLVANYTTGSVVALPIESDGALGPPATFVQHEGASIHPERQTGPHAHCFVISPDNRFAYAADLGLDQIRNYRLDAEKAEFTPLRQAFTRTLPGAGPRHMTFHPNGKQVYVINELHNSITLFDFEASSGHLLERQTVTTLPAGFQENSACADVKVSPNGRFLYGTNRGHDSIAAYRLDQDGQMTLVDIFPSLGAGPQNIAITPDGNWLLCANMPGHNVVVFRIDGTSGSLQAVGEPISIASPACLQILR